MRRWILLCPNCGTENEAQKAGLAVACGTVKCACTCANCGTNFEAEQEYWRWLGVEGGPRAAGRSVPPAAG